MGENVNPLDELKKLDQQVDRVTALEGLKPIFFRLDEIAKANPHDFVVQLVAGDIKQHLVNRGTKLKEQVAPAVAKPPVVPAAPAPLPPGMVSASDAPTVKWTPPGVSSPPAQPPPTPAQAAPTVPPRSPLDGPAPLAEIKGPGRLMSSGQFSNPAKPPQPISQPTPPAPGGPPPIAAGRPQPQAQPPIIPPQAPAAAPPQIPSQATVPPSPAARPPIPAPVIPPPVIPRPQAPQPPAPSSPQSSTRTMSVTEFGALGTAPGAAGPLATGPQTPPGLGPTASAGPSGPLRPPTVHPPLGSGAQPSPKPQPKQARGWKRPLLIGALLGALVAIVGIAFVVNLARKRNRLEKQENAVVQVQISTTPGNASVRINRTDSQNADGETKCSAPCAIPLKPGSYQVTAFLDGYDPATSALTVTAGTPPVLNLALTAQPQTVRILTDLDQGQVAFDDQPPVDLQEGQFILDKVAPGSHTVTVTAKSGDATFTFDIAEAKPPVLTGTIAARNLIAVVVSSFGNQARVVTNSGPLTLAVNGQAEEPAGPEGVDLKAFQPGVDELIVGDGKDQRNMKESFGPAPMLTAFLKSDLNIGTLIVSTGENDVRVYINDKEYAKRTQRGQLRIPAIGKVKVAIYKDGFQVEPAQTTEVKKGAEVRLEFKLKPMTVVTTLQIRGGTPGAEVLIDQSSVGTIGADGSFSYNSISPGDHAIELRRDQYGPKRFLRTFRAGQPVALTAADATLAAAAPSTATIRVTRTPANATVTYHRADENDSHELRAPQVDLPAGTYVFTSKAPGFADRTDRVQIAAGETRTLDIAMTARPAAVVVKNGDVTDFEEAGAWKKEGDLWVHKGGGFVPYKLGPRGVYNFTVELVKGGGVFRGGRIRWAVQYIDSKNYLSYEMDRHTFWAYVTEKGKKLERQKTPLQLDNGKTYSIQIDISPDHVVHKLKTGDAAWLTLDSFAEPGRNFTAGKFGFLIQGNDEIGISEFTFSPK